MSVYIKGMEMPGEGRSVSVRIWNDAGDGRVIGINNPDMIKDAFQIPAHGDLIDRDDLSKRLNKLCDRVCVFTKAQRSAMCSACSLGDAFAVVEDDAPAIIPADKEGEA